MRYKNGALLALQRDAPQSGLFFNKLAGALFSDVGQRSRLIVRTTKNSACEANLARSRISSITMLLTDRSMQGLPVTFATGVDGASWSETKHFLALRAVGMPLLARGLLLLVPALAPFRLVCTRTLRRDGISSSKHPY